MKICISANHLLDAPPGSVKIYLSELVKRWPGLAPQHAFRLFFNSSARRRKIEAKKWSKRDLDVRICRLTRKITRPLLWRFGMPVDWLAGKADVMFSPMPDIPVFHGGRTVVTVHDLLPVTHPEYCDRDYAQRFTKQASGAIPRAERIVAVSNYTAQLIEECYRISPDRIRCVPNGVDETFSPPADSEDAGEAARKFGIEGPYLLYVGSGQSRKNLVRVIEAYGMARSSAMRDHSLVLAGYLGRDLTALNAACRSLDPEARVHMPGYIDRADLPKLYGAATAFVFPSIVEGFGIPPLEAMACGCPVLTSTAAALREVVDDAALTVDPFDVDAISEGLHRLVEESDLRRDLKDRGLKRARKFSWDRTAAETLQVITEARNA
jgi:glycosyltransferase involved in cell wall biosynthesis